MDPRSEPRQPLPIFTDHEEFDRYLDARIGARLSQREAEFWLTGLKIVAGATWFLILAVWALPLIRR